MQLLQFVLSCNYNSEYDGQCIIYSVFLLRQKATECFILSTAYHELTASIFLN